MTGVPFSIRLPSSLVELVQALAKKAGVTTPEAVRAAIELSVQGNEYRLQIIERLKKPADVLRLARVHIKNGAPMMPADYSALMHFWHRAYMSGDGFANPNYVSDLLDITLELLSMLQSVGADAGFNHARSTLGLNDGETLQSGIARVKHEFAANPSVSWAEYLTRPLEGMADDLKYLDRNALPKIFGMRLRTLLPVAVRGAEVAVTDDLIDWDMKALLPEIEHFKMGDLIVSLHSFPLAIVVEEGHHCYAFAPESVLGIATGIENRAFGSMGAAEGNASIPNNHFRRSCLDVKQFQASVILHENTGYRLSMSIPEFTIFVKTLELKFTKPSWVWLLNRHRDLQGDI